MTRVLQGKQRAVFFASAHGLMEQKMTRTHPSFRVRSSSKWFEATTLPVKELGGKNKELVAMKTEVEAVPRTRLKPSETEPRKWRPNIFCDSPQVGSRGSAAGTPQTLFFFQDVCVCHLRATSFRLHSSLQTRRQVCEKVLFSASSFPFTHL